MSNPPANGVSGGEAVRNLLQAKDAKQSEGSTETPPHKRFEPHTLGLVAVARAYDHLSDEEVYEQCIKPVRPVTGPKNIWAFWNTGWDKCPDWRKRTSIDWIRRNGPEWQLRILDSIPGSPWNLNEWIGAHYFPRCYHDGSILRDDRYGVQHISDFARPAVLIEYGGVWLDMDLALHHNLDDLCWRNISDPNHPLEICTGAQTDDQGPNVILNSFIAVMPDNLFMRNWSKTYLALWPDGVTNAKGFHDHPLIRNYPQIRIVENWRYSMGEELTPGDVNDYISFLVAGSRLMCIAEPTPGGWDGPAYARAHMRFLSLYDFFPRNDMWDYISGFTEQRQWELLQLQRPSDPAVRRASADHRDAELLCVGTLAESIFIKRGSGLHLLDTVARLWTKNPGTDSIPGTWGYYMRWGRIHLDQLHRAPKLWVPGERNFVSGFGTAWRVGLLEPVTKTTESFTP